MFNTRQKIIVGGGACSVLLCFFLESVFPNTFWSILGCSFFLVSTGCVYWGERQKIRHSLPLLEATTLNEDTIEGVFYEEEPRKKENFEELPEAPIFPHTLPDMDEKTFILGYTRYSGKNVPVKDDMDEGVMSTSVIGKPKRGKTTLLYFFIAQMILKQSHVMIFDPHATLSKLKNIFPYAHNCDAILSHVPEIHKELQERMERYDANGGVCLDDPFWLVVDELPLLSLHELMLKKKKKRFESAIDVIQRVILEGRKFRMYCLVSGQSIPASVLPTLARDNIASHYAFFCSDDHARMSGFTRLSIKQLLPRLRMAIGKCILDAATMEKAMLVAIPYTTADHIYTLVQTHSYTGIRSFVSPIHPTYIDVPGFGTVEKKVLDHILAVIQNGGITKRADVCREAHLNNRYYPVVRYVCNQHGLLQEKVRERII